MTKFEDHLLDDLMREHGTALATAPAPATRSHRLTVPRPMLATAGGGLAVAAAVAGTLVASGGSPAYAVTKQPDGALKVSVYKKSGFAGANARLRQLDDGQVVVVPAGSACPSLTSLPAPPVSGKGDPISVAMSKPANGSVTVDAQGIPTGDMMVIVLQTTGTGTTGASGLTAASATVPSCLSLPAAPARSSAR